MRRMLPPRDYLKLEAGLTTLLIGPREFFGAVVPDNLLAYGISDLEEALRSFAWDAGEVSKLRRYHLMLTGFPCDRLHDHEIAFLLARELRHRRYVAVRLPRLIDMTSHVNIASHAQATQIRHTLARLDVKPARAGTSSRSSTTRVTATRPSLAGSGLGNVGANSLAFSPTIPPTPQQSIVGPPAAPANTVPASIEDRFIEVLKRVPNYLPGQMKAEFMALLQPVPLAMMAGTLALWAAGHAFGVSEVIDAFLLGFGLGMLGTVVFHILGELIDVFKLTIGASSPADLNEAARKLADVIALIGVAAFVALLTKVAGKFLPKPKSGPKPPEPKPPEPKPGPKPPEPKPPEPKPEPEPKPLPAEGKVNPTGTKGGTPSGRPTKIRPQDDAATQRSLQRENESAETLARNGYKVEQNPGKQPNGTNPDYKVEGEIFDNYAPGPGKKPRGIWSEVENKVVEKQQTNGVVLNLDDWGGDTEALQAQFRDHPIPGLEQVLVVKNGQVSNLF
jgi:Contact-dependent growth inhibition CdiA C-terminal domain